MDQVFRVYSTCRTRQDAPKEDRLDKDGCGDGPARGPTGTGTKKPRLGTSTKSQAGIGPPFLRKSTTRHGTTKHAKCSKISLRRDDPTWPNTTTHGHGPRFEVFVPTRPNSEWVWRGPRPAHYLCKFVGVLTDHGALVATCELHGATEGGSISHASVLRCQGCSGAQNKHCSTYIYECQ